MAFFTDTISKQVATQLNVADQIQRQKQAEQATAMAQYALAKKFGDNKLEGQSTRTMMNQGLIPGLFTQGMDGLRGLAQGVGMDVKGVERHAHNVDNSLTNSLLPDSEGLTAEQLANNERVSQLQNMSTADRIKAAAFRAYDEKYPGATDEEKEEFYRNDYLDNKGDIRSRKSLNKDNVGDYEKHRAAIDEEAKGELFKDEHEGLRKEMKRHGIDKMKEFSGSHSNMRNQNLKVHKTLIDYYVKNKQWDKAEELNQAYIQNEMNIDKHWGMGGERKHSGLFKRPTGGTGPKKDNILMEYQMGNGTTFTVDAVKGGRNDINSLVQALRAQGKDVTAEQLTAMGGIADMRERAKSDEGLSMEQQNMLAQASHDEAKELLTQFWGPWKDKEVNKKYADDPTFKWYAVGKELHPKSSVLQNPGLRAKVAASLGLTQSQLLVKHGIKTKGGPGVNPAGGVKVPTIPAELK